MEQPEKIVIKAEKHLEKLVADKNRIADEISAEISSAETKNFGPLVVKLNQELKEHNDRYVPIIECVIERIKDANIQVENKNKRLEDSRKENEKVEKNRALNAWLRSGGDLSGFEAAWPHIREAQLTDATLTKMKEAASNDLNFIKL